MAFCINCGQELADGAKFCANCGISVGANQSEKNGQRKSIYEGEVHKCPNCGEILESFITNCPSCGYELRGTQGSSITLEFANKLMATTDEKQLVNLIRGFSIPNTREDVLEFFILASSNYDYYVDHQDVSKAWLAKLEQCHQKAKILLINEPEYSEIEKLYTEIHTKLKKARKRQLLVGASKRLVSSLTVLTVKCVGVICAIASFLKAISIDRTGENGVGFELLGGLLLIISAVLLFRKRVTAFELLFTGAGGILTFILAKQLENGAGLQLIGAVALILVGISFIKFICGSKSNLKE